ncbi:hypothetical protein Tco_1152394 [Tanacetum coccineum]
MSSASSTVTYTFVYIDSEPGRVFWGADEEISDEGSPRVIDEDVREPMFIQPHDPDYVPEPIYLEYIPLEDENEFPAKEQPLPPDGLADYAMDGGEDGDDDDGDSFGDDGDSSGDDADDEDEDEEDEEELGLLSGFRLPYPFHQRQRCTALPTHSSPPPVPSPLLPSSGCPTQIQTLRIASTQALIDVVTAALPSPPLPPSLYILPPVDHRDDIPESERPPRKRSCLFALGYMYEVGESSTARPTRGRGVDYGFVRTLDAEERQRGIREVGYGIRDTWVDLAEAVPEIAPMTVGEVNTRVTELVELHKHDTQDLYALLEDAQDSRTRISQRVTMDSQRVDLLMEDRITH